MRGILRQDLSEALPKVRVIRDAAIPSVWDAELVVKLLQAVDRTSPVGKRDYAMLLLASRLGLRVSDLRTLRLDDLDWGASTIGFTQSKTSVPLRLPISEEVGEALIDYLRFGRPKTEHREVFVTLPRPVGPFAEDAKLYHVVNRWRDLAGHWDPSTPLDAVVGAHSDQDWRIRIQVAQRSDLPLPLFYALSNDSHYRVRLGIAEHEAVPEAILRKLSADAHYLVRAFAAENPNTPTDVLSDLKRDSNEVVQCVANGSHLGECRDAIE